MDMEFGKFQSFHLRKGNSPTSGVKVLVADHNPISRYVVARMLQCLGYEVVTAARAIEALYIIEENKDVLNLALVDSRWSDIEIQDLIEKMREICTNLPCFIMTAAAVADEVPISLALYKGAMLFFKKPLFFAELSGLWRFAKWNRRERRTIVNADGQGFEWYTGEERQPLMNIGRNESSFLKMKRVIGTHDFPEMFFESAAINASPMKMQHVMDVSGLTEQHISNYVQECLQSRNQRGNEQNLNRQNWDLMLGSRHLSQAVIDKGKFLPFLDQKNVANNSINWGNYQNDLNSNFMPTQLLATPAHFPSQEISSGQSSTFGQDELGLPGILQGVTHTSSGFGEFMNEGNGEASAESSQVENATDGKAFNEDKLDSFVDSADGENEMQFSTLLANDMSQQIFPELPVPPLPSDEKEHEIFGAEAGKIDEFLYGSKETEQFSDDDLNMWLSKFNSS